MSERKDKNPCRGFGWLVFIMTLITFREGVNNKLKEIFKFPFLFFIFSTVNKGKV